jgi:hypothetical protein
MREILLTQGKVALVDDADFAWLTEEQIVADRWEYCYETGRLQNASRKRASGVAMYLSGARRREIARELEIDRETVTRIVSQERDNALRD